MGKRQFGGNGGAIVQDLTLTPSMAASVEIATGDWWFIYFVLSPTADATSEVGSER